MIVDYVVIESARATGFEEKINTQIIILQKLYEGCQIEIQEKIIVYGVQHTDIKYLAFITARV